MARPKKTREPATESAAPQEETGLDLTLFPVVPETSRPKEIVFDTLSQAAVEALAFRGYSPILLRTLPRRSPQEDVVWLGRLMQGAAEGTVALPKDRAEALHFELKTRGLLANRAVTLNIHAAVGNESIENMLAWKTSTHTFGENTTQVSPEKVRAFLARVNNEPVPGKREAVPVVLAKKPPKKEQKK